MGCASRLLEVFLPGLSKYSGCEYAITDGAVCLGIHRFEACELIGTKLDLFKDGPKCGRASRDPSQGLIATNQSDESGLAPQSDDGN